MKRKRRSIILDVVILAAAVGIGCFLVAGLPRILPDTVIAAAPSHTDPATPSASYDTLVRPGRLPGYENAAENRTPEYFCYLYNSRLSASSQLPCNVLLENTPGNTCDMVVTFTTKQGEEIYRSPVLQPGEYLLYGALTALPDAGEHTVSVAIEVYEAGQAEHAEEPFAIYRETATLTVL